MINGDSFYFRNASNLNDNRANRPVENQNKTNIIHVNWGKIATGAAKTMYDCSGFGFVVDNLIALGEINESEKIMIELNEMRNTLEEKKKSGVYNKKEMTELQDNICIIEKKADNLSEMTKNDIQVPIRKLFQSVAEYYNECSSKNTVI